MFKKIVTGFALFLFLLAALLIIVPLAFKTQINNWVKNQINTGINAKVDYANVSITCFKNFPNVDVSLHQLSITGDSLFRGDTLASIDNFDLTIDIHSLLSGSQYKILQCSINHPQLKFRSDSLGRANWHILKQLSLIPGVGVVTTADTSHVTLQIDHYRVLGAEVLYTDAQRKFIMDIHDLNLEGNIQSSVIQSGIKIVEFSVGNGGKKYFNKMRVASQVRYNLSGDSLLLDTLSAVMDKNDMQGKGSFNNVLASQMGQATFTARLNLKSQFFDLNNWLENAFTASAKRLPVAAPVHIAAPVKATGSAPTASGGVDVIADVAFDTIYLNKLLLQHAKAEVSLQKDSVSISGFACNLLGGKATANLKLVHQHDIKFQFNIAHCDIQQTCSAVPVADKIAPVARYIQGSFSAELKAQGKLNEAMNLDYNTLAGDGKIQISQSKITQIPALADVGKLAKTANLDHLEMTPTTSVIHCKNITVVIESTDIKFTNGFALNVKGSNTFNGDINYDMRLNVPTKQMGGIASLAQNFLSGIPGLNIKVPDFMSFSFNVTGTFAKPQAKLVNVGTGNVGQ